MAVPSLTKKRHDVRKNGASADYFKKLRHEQNMTRPKQRFVKDTDGGHWERP